MGCSMMAVSEPIPDVVTGSNPVLTTSPLPRVELIRIEWVVKDQLSKANRKSRCPHHHLLLSRNY